MSKGVASVAMVNGVLSLPPMTRDEILGMKFKPTGISLIRAMLMCGNVVHTKVFFLLINNQEEFISYISEQSLSHTIHYIGKWNDELRIVLSEPKDHQTNIDADVIDHLAKLFFNKKGQ